jgi:integrase
LQKLSPLHIQKYYNLKSKDLSGKTLLQHHRIMRKAFDQAYKMQIVSKNVFDLVQAPKAKKFKASVLSIEQGKQLINAAKNTKLEIPINLAIALGLRRGEVLGLRWSDIDFDNNLIYITNTLTIAGSEKVFKDPKNEDSDRVIPAPEELIRLLRIHKKKQLELQVRCGGEYKNINNLVNTNQEGNEVNPASFSSAFGEFIRKNDLPKVRFHDLRHTNATIMLTNGTQAKVASERLGHSTIKTTMDLYSHVLKDVNMEAAEKINSALYK